MHVFQSISRFAALGLALGLCGKPAMAREDINRPVAQRQPNQSATGNRPAADLKCLYSSSRAELDINNVRAMVLNGGDMWWDLNIARYEVPKVTDPNQPRRTSIFAGAVWIGGRDASSLLYTATQTYRQGANQDVGYWPGPLNDRGEVTRQTCTDFNAHSKVDRRQIDDFRGQSFPLSRDLAAQYDAIVRWPGSGNPELSWEGIETSPLAPFENNMVVLGNNPLVYEPLLGDYPKIDGDQAIWWVMNDVGNAKIPLTPPIGIELAVEAFAFQTSNLINSMTFYKQRIANKGNIQLNGTYFGQWVDPDLGYFNDDYVGCDINRGLGLCYNGDEFDEGANGYGNNPPTVGVDFFEGPLADPFDRIDNNRNDVVDEVGEKIIMSNFIYYNNDSNIKNGNPGPASDYYNYLRSLNRVGDPFLFGGDGVQGVGVQGGSGGYNFMFPAGGVSPALPIGFNPPRPVPFQWSESDIDGNKTRNPPGDRRFLQSAGPFTLRPGSVNQLTIGVIWAGAGSGGAQGSKQLATVADDLAQKTFYLNFEIPAGPPTPVVTLTELDQQIVLSIQPGILQGRYNTETYDELIGTNRYKFEGYLVYQLRNSTVSAGEVRDLNKARLIARGDIINGVTRITNREFSADVNDFVPVPKVDDQGADRGVFHTLNITTDQFAAGNNRLVNFHQYTFLVVPYAYNGDAGNPEPYLESTRTERETAIPHKTAPEQGGTVLNTQVGSQLAVQRLFGQGTGGAVVEITPESEEAIRRNEGPSPLPITYQGGHAPIDVRVYDPKLVKGGKFQVKLSSRLVYATNSLRGDRQPQVGDTIHSIGQYAQSESATAVTTLGNNQPFYPNVISSAAPQRKGYAIVRRIVSEVSGLATLDIQMLNDDIGGTFLASVDTYFNANAVTGKDPTTFNPTYSSSVPVSYTLEARDFEVLGTRGGAGGTTNKATAREYKRSDYWALYDNTGTLLKYADRTVSEFNEQLVPEFGLSIQLRHALDPGSNRVKEASLQFRDASLSHTGTPWLTGVPYEGPTTRRDTVFVNPLTGVTEKVINGRTAVFGTPWLLSAISNDNSGLLNFDPTPTYNKVLPITQNRVAYGGTLAPYAVTLGVDATGGGDIEVGAAYTRAPERKLYNLQNVDIVFTSDKRKWTRVTVLQISADSGRTAGTGQRLTKLLSRTPSLNRELQPSNERSTLRPDSVSRGMSYFPGYAIDLDRGIRLNMAFSEDQAPVRLWNINQKSVGQGRVRGKNLKWEPSYSRNAGRNFVYVLASRYDEGQAMERYQDQINWELPLARRILATKALYDSVMMWVYNPRLIAGRQPFQNNSDARVRVRVDRYFTSYTGNWGDPRNTNPAYSFEINDVLAVATNQRDVACRAVTDLVRVVPNPYYAFSGYENSQIDNFVKITNIPRRAEIDIYTLSGVLVRRLRKDDPRTFIDWDLKNASGLPIASGVYLFHVKAPDVGCEVVVKWFGILRPTDLESF